MFHFILSDFSHNDAGRMGCQRLNNWMPRGCQVKSHIAWGSRCGQTQLYLECTDVLVYFSNICALKRAFCFERLSCAWSSYVQQEKAIPSLFLRIPGTGFLICLKQWFFFFFRPWQHPFSVVSNCSVLEDIIVEKSSDPFACKCFL